MEKRDDFLKRIYKYQTASEFLRGYYGFRKSLDRRWSYLRWAKKLNEKKPTLVRTTNGTLLVSEKMEKNLCDYFKFNSSQKRYFKFIVASEKISRLYPGVKFQFPEMNEMKISSLDLKVLPSIPSSKARLLSLPEVQWIASLFTGSGMKSSDLLQISEHLHPALQKLDVKDLVRQLLEIGILEERQGRVFFKSLDSLFLDANVTGMEVAVQRYTNILNSFKEMILLDFNEGRIPLVNNRGCTIKIKKEFYPDLIKQLDKNLRDLMALYENDSGDVVLDLEIFMAPTASLNRPYNLSTSDLVPKKQ